MKDSISISDIYQNLNEDYSAYYEFSTVKRSLFQITHFDICNRIMTSARP